MAYAAPTPTTQEEICRNIRDGLTHVVLVQSNPYPSLLYPVTWFPRLGLAKSRTRPNQQTTAPLWNVTLTPRRDSFTVIFNLGASDSLPEGLQYNATKTTGAPLRREPDYDLTGNGMLKPFSLFNWSPSSSTIYQASIGDALNGAIVSLDMFDSSSPEKLVLVANWTLVRNLPYKNKQMAGFFFKK